MSEEYKPKLVIPEQLKDKTMLSDTMGEGFIKLSGKQYLQVAYRVIHFRHNNPDGTIYTEVVKVGDRDCILATIAMGYDVMATAHKVISWDAPTKSAAGKYPIETAETGAIGRALALCGYGTLSGDFEEGDELADSPLMTGRK